MAIVDFSTLDLTPYQSAPSLPADATYTLADDLYNARPANAPAHVEKAAKRMRETADEIKTTLVERIEGTGFDLVGEVAFDTTTDRCWSSGRKQLEIRMQYLDPGYDRLDPAEQAAIDLPGKRKVGEVARKLDGHLFGAEGLAFLNKPMREQVVAMATRLEFITKSEDHEVYEVAIGEDLLKTLLVLQGRYEAIVHARATRNDPTADLRALRRKLQRHIGMYSTAVLTMLDEDDPQSVEVLDTLRPMVYVRDIRTSSGGGVVVTVDADVTEPIPADDALPLAEA